jgi:hypothetical protein
MSRRRRLSILRLVVSTALLGAAAIGLVALRSRPTVAQNTGGAAICYGNLDDVTYRQGITSGTFPTMNAIKIGGGGLQLDTNLTPLDPQHIVLPFDQRVKINYVYKLAGYSHSIGWFFFDQVQPWLDANGKLVDADRDGVPDFFQAKQLPLRPRDGLWTIKPGYSIPTLVDPSQGQNVGGTYPRIPLLLQSFMNGNGGMIFKLSDDDGNLSVGHSFAPVADVVALEDGIPDYDVNGDGTAGNEADRSVDLGIIPGNREIVFFAMNYGTNNLRAPGVGLPVGPPSLNVANPSPGGRNGDSLVFVGYTDATTGGKTMRWDFSNTAYTFNAGECLSYDYFIPTTSCLSGVGGVDIRLSDGSMASSYAGWPSAAADLTASCGTWVTRQIPIPAGLVGKTSSRWSIHIENDTPNERFELYIDNVEVDRTCGGTRRTWVYGGSGAPSQNAVRTNVGWYSNATVPTYTVNSWPWFTKNMLNADFRAYAPNTVIQRVAIGCTRDDAACYASKRDASNQPATLGWLDTAAMNRLNTPVYGNLNIAGDNTVVDVASDADGNTPHFVVFAPNSDKNRWILGFDDQPGYPGYSDFDYNDVVFTVDRVNGGQLVSDLISSGIPANKLDKTVISRIRIKYTATFPSPGCDGITSAEIKIFYSVDGKQTWRQVTFPSKTSGEATIDVLGTGDIGNQLYWKAEFVSPTQTCNPVLTYINVGYEAVEAGEFRYSAPIPLVNVAYVGSMQSPPFINANDPAATANDYSLRGHLRATRFYDPANPAATTITPLWDAGARLSRASFSPDARNIFTSVNGARVSFTAANAATLYPQFLPQSARNQKYASKPIYDLTGDGIADDQDARFILEWTRGWEYSGAVTMNPPQTPLMRAWRLGAIHVSSPVVVTPPPRPLWIEGGGAPPAFVTKHDAFRVANQTRPTRALAGAQDGMIHAFDAGKFRWGSSPDCTFTLERGCWAGATDLERYGTGDEVWAFIPPSQLPQIRNNHPKVRRTTNNLPIAEVDGSISAEDIYVPSVDAFRTVAFASTGRESPYITAIDVTSDNAQPLWANDWTDPDYYGTDLSPSVALVGLSGGKFVTVVTSGLAAGKTIDNYLYVIDAATGVTITKNRLNPGTGQPQAQGIAGYPNLVDANQDGVVDRAYAVDTLGRVYKYDFTTGISCVIARAGETVYSSMATLVAQRNGNPVVWVYFGGGPNPDGTGTVADRYSLFAFRDENPIGSCSTAALEYQKTLPPGQRNWSAPSISDDIAFFATAGSPSLGVCESSRGALWALPTMDDGKGNAVGTPVSPLDGSPVSGIRVYDGHVFVNTVSNQTTIVGKAGWNNPAPGGSTNGRGQPARLSAIQWVEQ